MAVTGEILPDEPGFELRFDEVYDTDPDDLWAAILRRKGRRYALLSTMPPDPSLN